MVVGLQGASIVERGSGGASKIKVTLVSQVLQTCMQLAISCEVCTRDSWSRATLAHGGQLLCGVACLKARRRSKG